jgi:hypothetical protein
MNSALEDLLDKLDVARERTLMALETLPDEALVAPGVIGRWSVADLLSILTAWDAEVVTGLLRLQQGKPPEKLLAAVANPDLYNAARYQDAQGRDLDVIFEDFQGARLHLEEWLGELSERALTDPRHYKSLGGMALGKLIARATYEHEARYLPFLTTFADRWEPEDDFDAGASDAPDLIMLGDIGLSDDDQANGLLSANGDGPEEIDDDELDEA